MNWLNRLEAKYGRYAIRNLPMYIVMMYAVGAVLDIISNGQFYYQYLSLNPYMILHGQVWRLVTFLFAAPNTNIFFLIFVMLFYYSICQELTNVWGAFRFNMYIFIGVLATILGSFLVYIVYPSPYIYMDTYYLNLSLFLAYAAIFPESMVYLYGILPIKIKWMAYLDLLFLGISFFSGGMGDKISIVMSLLNFILFYFSSRNYKQYSPKEVKRRRTYHQKVTHSQKPYRHQCAVCKRTELDDPTLDFRFCSKCDGDYEYCNEHLFTHTHIKH